MDWTYSQPMNFATFLDLAVDIHHIFVLEVFLAGTSCVLLAHATKI